MAQEPVRQAGVLGDTASGGAVVKCRGSRTVQPDGVPNSGRGGTPRDESALMEHRGSRSVPPAAVPVNNPKGLACRSEFEEPGKSSPCPQRQRPTSRCGAQATCHVHTSDRRPQVSSTVCRTGDEGSLHGVRHATPAEGAFSPANRRPAVCTTWD